MLRRLLAPRLLVLHLVALALVGAMVWLGLWQAQRYGEAAAEPPQHQQPAPLRVAATGSGGLPADRVGAAVWAAGRFARPRHQLLVTGRALRGRPGWWVLTPLVLPDGRAVPVVRGWVPHPDAPGTAVPPGPVRVTGRWLPSEPARFGPFNLPARTVSAIRTPELVGLLPYDLYDGYLVLAEIRPGSSPAPAQVRPTGAPAADGGGLRNLAYAAQWWLFAAFGVFMWWRIARDLAASVPR